MEEATTEAVAVVAREEVNTDLTHTHHCSALTDPPQTTTKAPIDHHENAAEIATVIVVMTDIEQMIASVCTSPHEVAQDQA